MKKFIITFLILIFAAINCNIAQASKISPEILHNMQTAYYDTGDTQKVLNAVLTTLYDSDYTIEDYDQDLGLIRAKKTFKAKYTSKKRIAGWSAVLLAASAYTAFSYGVGFNYGHAPNDWSNGCINVQSDKKNCNRDERKNRYRRC